MVGVILSYANVQLMKCMTVAPSKSFKWHIQYQLNCILSKLKLIVLLLKKVDSSFVMLSNFTLVKTVHFDLILTQINTNKTSYNVLLHLGYRCIFSLCGANLKTHFSRSWVRKKNCRFLSGCELAGYRIIFSVYCNYSAGVLRETVYCSEWSDKPHVPPRSEPL